MKCMSKKIALCALIGLALPMSVHATALLQNPYVQAGVSDFGTLGSNGNASPGILFDSTGTSKYGVNDFLTPGTPFEGFYITFTSPARSYYSNNAGGGLFSFVLTKNSSTSVTAEGVSSDNQLGVKNEYSLTTVGGRSVIAITTTLTNKADRVLEGIKFLRTTDPDPDVNAFGSYNTVNLVVSDDEACSTGVSSGQTICIFADSAFAHKAGVSQPWSVNPDDYLAGTNGGNGDFAIGIGFDLGNLDAGQSLTLTYGYALGATRDDATGGGSIPEPMSALLLGTGLMGLALSRRTKQSKA